jgi:uncharacterized protein (DUF779 family)
MAQRLIVTPEALDLVRRLKAEHGALIFHLSGGCCEGTAPMCFRQADFRAAADDVLLGTVEGFPFYVNSAKYAYWANWEITLYLTTGAADSFSIEAADGVRFAVRSRLFTGEELDALRAAGLA